MNLVAVILIGAVAAHLGDYFWGNILGIFWEKNFKTFFDYFLIILFC
jgi:hypothetical protein